MAEPGEEERRERRSSLRALGLALGLVGLAWALFGVAVWLVERDPPPPAETTR